MKLVLLFLLTSLHSNELFELTDANFQDFTTTHNKFFVIFYSDDCLVCTEHIKLLEQVKKSIALEEYNIQIAKVNSIEKMVLDKFQIKSFPEFRLAIDNNAYIYDRDLSQKSL